MHPGPGANISSHETSLSFIYDNKFDIYILRFAQDWYLPVKGIFVTLYNIESRDSFMMQHPFLLDGYLIKLRVKETIINQSNISFKNPDINPPEPRL